MKSMRFNPSWDEGGGRAVCGLIEMMCDIGELKTTKTINCIEIGTYTGESALIISSFTFIHSMICIDPYFTNIASKRLNHKNNIKLIPVKSSEYVENVSDQSIDMIYIDGCHKIECIYNDLYQWYPKIKNNGFICGHDYIPKFQPIIDTVNDFADKHKFLIKTYRDGSYLMIKNN